VFDIQSYNTAVDELNTFIALVRTGHRLWVASVDPAVLARQINEVLARSTIPPFPSDQYHDHNDDVDALPGFAVREHEKGFPYLFELAAVRLWSILETMTDDLVLALLRVHIDDLADKELSRG
jgi:hypothetical protein